MGILDNLKKTLDDKRKEVEKEVKRNIASYKDLALQTVDEAKESSSLPPKKNWAKWDKGMP